MKIANKELLDNFVQTHAQAVKPLNKWVEMVNTIKLIVQPYNKRTDTWKS